MELWARARRGYDQMALLEDELTRASPDEHRSRALSVSAAAIPVLELDRSEVGGDAVLATSGDETQAWLARVLATDARAPASHAASAGAGWPTRRRRSFRSRPRR